MILVFGATGNVGGALVHRLADAGAAVRAVVRDPHGGHLPVTDAGGDVQLVAGDLQAPETLRPALAGVDAAFLLSGYHGIDTLVPEMAAAGIGRVVLLSSGAAPGGNLTNAVARYHIASERAVRDSGLAWTFLQPNSFMTNTFEWIAQLRKGDLVRAPFADVAVATIDPADIAAVAARALLPHLPGPPVDLDRRGLRLSGPEALRPADRVRLLGAALGRDLRFQPIPDDEARREMSATMPAEYVDAFFSFFVDGTLDETTVHPTVGEVLGRDPRPFSEWVAEHVDRFR